MKKILNGFAIGFALAIMLALWVGCDTPPEALFHAQVEEVPAVTNGNEVIPAHTVTNYAARPEIVATAKGIGMFVPQPWGSIGASVVTAVLAIWGALATRKKNRLAQVAGEQGH